jgi:hypothetical protein
MVVADSGVLAGEIGVVWAAGDVSLVTTGVIEAGESRGTVPIARDWVGSAKAGVKLFPLHTMEKTVKSRIVAVRIKPKGFNIDFLVSQKVTAYIARVTIIQINLTPVEEKAAQSSQVHLPAARQNQLHYTSTLPAK